MGGSSSPCSMLSHTAKPPFFWIARGAADPPPLSEIDNF